MDFDADYDSGKFFYKNGQPTHFLRFSRFLIFFFEIPTFSHYFGSIWGSCESPSKTTSNGTIQEQIERRVAPTAGSETLD